MDDVVSLLIEELTLSVDEKLFIKSNFFADTVINSYLWNQQWLCKVCFNFNQHTNPECFFCCIKKNFDPKLELLDGVDPENALSENSKMFDHNKVLSHVSKAHLLRSLIKIDRNTRDVMTVIILEPIHKIGNNV